MIIEQDLDLMIIFKCNRQEKSPWNHQEEDTWSKRGIHEEKKNVHLVYH